LNACGTGRGSKILRSNPGKMTRTYLKIADCGDATAPCVVLLQYRFKHTTRRRRFAPRTSIGNNPPPLAITKVASELTRRKVRTHSCGQKDASPSLFLMCLFRASLFSKSEPMVKSADEPECIHREPRQGEHAGKPYFASSHRRARSYAQYSVFQTPGPRASRSQR
jgi:hypothetical protein